jgi:hypothetical protein
MARPARQICQVCAHDEVDVVLVDDVWLMICEDGCHPRYEWNPTPEARLTGSYRNGLGQELGVYDALLDCVVDGLAEYGVVEHRFAERSRSAYDFLVNRYGHTAKPGPSRYTASAFLGGALGQLWREELVDGGWGPATGYWSYNGEVGAYGPPGTSVESEILSWEDYAVDVLKVDPGDWPALGHKAS